MLLRTLAAPLDFAILVMAPLCCMTLVLPSSVASPFTTETVKCSSRIFDFASFVFIARSIWESAGVFGRTGCFDCFAALPAVATG
jgi:hypothetical protein